MGKACRTRYRKANVDCSRKYTGKRGVGGGGGRNPVFK